MQYVIVKIIISERIYTIVLILRFLALDRYRIFDNAYLIQLFNLSSPAPFELRTPTING
jgi:hypothetical protein